MHELVKTPCRSVLRDLKGGSGGDGFRNAPSAHRNKRTAFTQSKSPLISDIREPAFSVHTGERGTTNFTGAVRQDVLLRRLGKTSILVEEQTRADFMVTDSSRA